MFCQHTDEYQMLRLTEGVAEGCDEVPPADCLPLEYNLDYMKGGGWGWEVWCKG